MEVSYDPDGRAYVSRYELGDLVRLRLSETGEGAMGKIGDWGIVVAVEGGLGTRFDIQLAGYSEPRTSRLKRLTGLTRRLVVPCDRNGVPVALAARTGLRALESDYSRRLGKLR